jgi:HSP20 family protein
MVLKMVNDNSIQVSTRPFSQSATQDQTPADTETDWSAEEGVELPIDLARRGQTLIIRAPIVGATADDISVTVNQDILFIHKGATPPPTRVDNYYTRECHWGPIARELHLPLPVDPSGTQAKLKDGVLTITLPIIKQTGRTKVIKIQ